MRLKNWQLNFKQKQSSLPYEQELETVVMVADISGFTMMSEELNKVGAEVNLK